MKGEDTVSIEVPAPIVERVTERLPRTRFDTEAEYISHVLEVALGHLEGETGDHEFEAADEEEVRDRLKSLGYLNE